MSQKPARPSEPRRCLVDGDQPTPPPADAHQPRPRPRDRRPFLLRSDGPLPSIEPRSRRARIDPAAAHTVLAPILKNIDQPVAHLSRRPQHAAVVAICQDAPPAAQPAVDCLCEPDGQALHSPCKRPRLFCLDEEMDVVHLDGELHHPKPRAAGASEGLAQRREEACATHRRKTAHEPQRHVDGMPATVKGTSAMRRAGPRSCRFATRARAATTPGTECEGELSRGVAHLDWADIIENKGPCQVLRVPVHGRLRWHLPGPTRHKPHRRASPVRQ